MRRLSSKGRPKIIHITRIGTAFSHCNEGAHAIIRVKYVGDSRMPPCADRPSQQNKEIQEPWVWAQTHGKAVLGGSVACRSLTLSPGQGAFMTFDPGGSNGKESACSAGDQGSILGWGRSPGEGDGNPLQDSRLENPMDRGAWRSTVTGSQKVGHN